MLQAAFTTGAAPSDGVYRFTFGVNETGDGSFAVPASAAYDVRGAYEAVDTFSYGFLGTRDGSCADDIPASPSCAEPTAIDGFQVVQRQKIVLHDTNDLNNVACVCGPAASEYLPAGASPYEGRYPVRFAMRGEERAYYAVTCTVANASSSANADVTLFSERQHLQAHHLTLAPGETRTFAWSVELAPNVYKTQGTYYDNAVNVAVVGENAAIASLVIVKQPQTSGTVRGEAVADIDRVFAHQANGRIIEAVARRMKLPLEKFFLNLDTTANTSAASIPISLDEAVRKGELRDGMKILMIGFGAGLTYGGVRCDWPTL